MRITDDPWRNFDPANPNSRAEQPQTQKSNYQAQNNNSSNGRVQTGEKLPESGIYADTTCKFRIGDTTVDLGSPEYRQILLQLKDGQSVIIGRDSNQL